jgi:drug/metabolite transporter (DMT)-like permease
MNSGLAPFTLAQGRITFAAALTFLWLAFKNPGELRVNRKDFLHFILLGTIGMAANSGCYLAAVSKIPTAAAILLQYLAPALIALYAWRFMAERMGAVKILALLLAFIGCYLVVGGYNLNLLSLNRWGLVWGLGSAATFAFYCIYTEYALRSYSARTVLCYALIMGSIAWSLAFGPQKLLNMGWDKRSWLLIFYSASMGTVIPFGIFGYGIDQLRATRATIISTFEPIAAALIAYLC